MTDATRAHVTDRAAALRVAAQEARTRWLDAATSGASADEMEKRRLEYSECARALRAALHGPIPRIERLAALPPLVGG